MTNIFRVLLALEMARNTALLSKSPQQVPYKEYDKTNFSNAFSWDPRIW